MTTQAKQNKRVAKLYERGWTITEAADQLGVNQAHLGRVLSGERESKRLLKRVSELPAKELILRRKKS